MIKNMKIKNFLILSFTVVLVLMIALGGASIFYSRKLANQTIFFYDRPHTVQLQVAEVRLLMADIAGDIKEGLIYRSSEKTKEVEGHIDSDIAEMTERIQIVKDRFSGDQELLEIADTYVESWLKEVLNIKDLLSNGQYEQAKMDFENTLLPKEEKMVTAVLDISNYSASVTDEFYATANRSKTISLCVIIGTIAFTVLITILLCSSIIKSILIPLNRIKKSSDALSKGDLHCNVDFEGENEFGQLAASMNKTVQTLFSYVQNIDAVLDRMSNNDMTVQVDLEYVGDFKPIKESMEKIIYSLHLTLSQIKQCSVQVAGGAENMSATSQSLSQGCSEQAASVEELSSSANEISEQVHQSSDFTMQTHKLVDEVGVQLSYGNEQMGQMLKAIKEINDTSAQIAKIIKTIEDIAFQTNILALNAAVEAARAGAAGKGFAVVADEVRNLAGKSAEAAKSTTTLIQNSIKAVKNGTNIADHTAETLSSVVLRAGQITEMVAKITISSEEQSSFLNRITESVEQIAQVVQNNSATSEESAATSEELSGQAAVMRDLVGKFKL